MTEIGWIKLHRSLLEWEWYDDIYTFKLFIHLLLKVNHKDKKYKGIIIKRSEIMTGIQLLSNETGISFQSIRTSLSKLKSTNDLTIKTSSQGTIIQVVNYDKYQELTNDSTNDQQTTNKQLTTNKNEKNEKNEKNIIPPTIEMILKYGKSRNNNVNINKFHNFYQSKNWMVGKNKMKDWQAAYRTWEPENKSNQKSKFVR